VSDEQEGLKAKIKRADGLVLDGDELCLQANAGDTIDTACLRSIAALLGEIFNKDVFDDGGSVIWLATANKAADAAGGE